MKHRPDEYFLAGSECKGSQKKGEGQVEEKRGKVSLCAIPGHKVYLRWGGERENDRTGAFSLRERERITIWKEALTF